MIKNNIIRVGNTELSTVDENNISYTNTDIYKASNRIAILQKIYNKIITDWVFDENDVIELYNLVMPNLECFKKRYLLLENNMMDEE